MGEAHSTRVVILGGGLGGLYVAMEPKETARRTSSAPRGERKQGMGLQRESTTFLPFKLYSN